MLNAYGRATDGRPLLMLGMTGENITRLMAAEPILLDVHSAQYGIAPMQVMLVAARDEQTLADQLRSSGLMPACCGQHGSTCGPAGRMCCRACTERTHPDHPFGVTCVNDTTATPGR